MRYVIYILLILVGVVFGAKLRSLPLVSKLPQY
jgi:hypothetical protein